MTDDFARTSEVPPALRATVLDRGYAARTLRLAGPVVATVEYRGYGLGYESVYVNRRLAARVSHQGPEMCAPRIEFEVGSGGRTVPAAIEVSMWPWFKIRQFRLMVDGLVVYSEGDTPEPVVIPPRSDLPIPASAYRSPSPGVLPIPSNPPPAAADQPPARTHPAVLPLVLLAALCPLSALVTDLFLPPPGAVLPAAAPSERRWNMMDTPAEYWLGYPAPAPGPVEIRPAPFGSPADDLTR
jgi:hypothetical protein